MIYQEWVLNDVPGFYALFFVLLILSVAYAKNFISKGLSLPVLVLLGEASYGLYILQKPVYMVYKTHITEYFNLGVAYDFYAYLALLIVIAISSFYIIEKPVKKMIFKLSDLIFNRNKAIV